MKYTCDIFCPDIALALIALAWNQLSEPLQHGIFYSFVVLFLLLGAYIFSGIKLGGNDAL